jgi:two-component system sensor histidine kinase UhpB
MRFSRLPLLWRVFAVNASLLLAATLVFALSRGPVTETVDILLGLAIMLAANLVLLRRTLSPVRRLVERMRTVDLLLPGQRLAADGGTELNEVVRAFNEMLERLEAERRESSRRALAAQESERLRVSRHLHDEVGQVLTGVLLRLDDDETKEAVRRSLDEVRRIAHELRPELLEHLGLVSALTEQARTFGRQTGISVETHFAKNLPPLSPESELAIYRVTQESFTNIARHAGADRVTLLLEAGNGSVVLRVIDNGRGLPESPPSGANGGLSGMRERAMLIGGALAIKPGSDGGLEVRLEAPAEPR